MDPVSDILRTLQIDALVQSTLEATSPWAVQLAVRPPQGVPTARQSLAQRHGAACFCLVSRGHCWLEIEGEKEGIALTGGDCFLLAPNITFRLSDRSRTTPVSFCDLRAKAVENVVHHGGGGAPTSLAWGLIQFRQGTVRAITDLLPRMIVVRSKHPSDSGLHNTLHLLASEMALQAPGSGIASNHLAEVLFVQILRAHIASIPCTRNAGWLSAIFDPQIGKALQALHTRIAAPWTVESIAAAAGMSRSSFAVRFKELLGLAPMQYLAAWRMQRSIQLLELGETKLSDLGVQVGYETRAAFNKAFKRTIGATPGQYRSSFRDQKHSHRDTQIGGAAVAVPGMAPSWKKRMSAEEGNDKRQP